MKNPTFIQLETENDGINVQRNFQCPEYNDCLTVAAFENLDLYCCACSLKDTKENISITKSDISRYIFLIESVFVPGYKNQRFFV
jgi:hypothetical protein